ncbi:cytochrome c oxidase subunit 3 family protein [Aromatoleum toluclasticum]|uniref:hypothetical protein n=1 Tax=Aromatoleum toluclasticum TaxID=92003 RepID=UPI00035F9D2F|nr:hypothetical protein [Aromatoleum toluclasticum]
MLSTLILVTSGLFVVLAVNAAKTGKARDLHFLGGMVVLAYLWFRARQGVDSPLCSLTESGALYWHMVDLL